MSTKKAHSSALKNNQALSLFYLFFHFKSSLERAGSRDSVLPSTPWRGCRREHRAQLISGSNIYDPREAEGRRCSVTAARSCGPGVARHPLEGQPRQRQLSFPRRLLGFWAWQGWGARRQVSGPGLMPKAPARPFCGAPSARTTRERAHSGRKPRAWRALRGQEGRN